MLWLRPKLPLLTSESNAASVGWAWAGELSLALARYRVGQAALLSRQVRVKETPWIHFGQLRGPLRSSNNTTQNRNRWTFNEPLL